jgi:hypothetical protein
MKRKGGYEAHDTGWHLKRHRHQVGLPNLRQFGETVEAARQPLQEADVA